MKKLSIILIIIFMTTVYWGVLEKEAGDTQTIDQAISTALSNYEYFKTISVWGLLPKSAIDDTTIEDRINELIASHEADATAHLGSGESLEAHKNADIIDHPASSVVPDKFSSNQPTFQNFFVSASTYDSTGTVDQSGNGNISLEVTAGTTQSTLAILLNYLDNTDFPGGDVMADFVIAFARGSTETFSGYFGMGDQYDGFGIEYTNAHYRAFYATAGTVTYSSWIEVSLLGTHTCRLYLSANDLNIYFSIDGTIVATIAFTATPLGTLTYFDIELNRKTGTLSQCLISMLRAYYNVI